jgi:phosphate transport system substrate-binding protein
MTSQSRARSARMSSRIGRAAVAVGLVAMSVAMAAPAMADSYVSISGAGSTWSQVAVDAWRADVRASGVVVNFAGTGSTDGRSQFIQGTVDFANTEIPFQNPPEPGQQAEIPSRPYAYMPIVAGGTSFMYNLTVGGKRVRDLRLSGPTLAKIFTGQISRWNDAAIQKDYGKTLPNIPIIPVVRSDGAGASAQFSLYMQHQTPTIYCPFIREKLHLSGSACPSVSFYPAFGQSKAQVGSNGVANYVSASYGAGAIGYVEYAYPKRINFPVASLLNQGGYYAQPTAGNVAVALTRAKINPNLTQNLESVYTNDDPRAYPMSSYSYMVVPTDTTKPFNAAKGKTLSTFINYFLCGGQQKADILGYSPLPKNLVQAGFDQVKRIPGAVESPSIDNCNNPALHILQTAPQPNKCLKAGAACGAATTTGSVATPSASSGSKSAPTTSGSSGTPTSGTSKGSGTSSGGSATTDGAAPSVPADPLTGAGGGTTTDTTDAGDTGDTGDTVLAAAAGVPLTIDPSRNDAAQNKALAWVTGLALVLAVLVPPLLIRRLSRR